jgi:Ca-activated chloride channel family protein
MAGTSMDLLKASTRAMVSNLREGDIVSMVEWSTTNAVHLEEYRVREQDDPIILDEIDALEAGGGTDLNAGLEAGYDIAARTFDPTRINRVVLVSDGGANAGVTSETLIARHAGTGDDAGIYLVGVGVGSASTYDDTLMDTVTDVGRGASVFIGTEAEALHQFGPAGFLQVMDVAYRDVGVRLELPPGFEITRFSGEEYSTDPREIEPQHIAPNDAMVFYQTLETCAPELATDDAELTVSVRYTDPLTLEELTTSVTARFGDLYAEDTRLLDKGAAVYAYAEALRACQEGAESAWPTLLAPALARLEQAERTNPGDTDLAELRRVMEALGG